MEEVPIIGEVAAYEPSVEGIKRNLTDLNAQINEKKTAYDRFKTSIGAKIVQIREAITGLKGQLQKLNKEKGDIEGRITDLEGRLRDSGGENVRLRQQLEQLERSKGDIDRDLQSINDQINQIRIIISGLDPSADLNGDIITQLDGIIATLRGEDNRDPSGPVNPESFILNANAREFIPGRPRALNPGRGGKKYTNTKNTKTQKGGRKHKSRMIKCRSKSRKQRGGFIALFKQKPSGQTQTSSTSGKKNKNKKSKKDKKRFKKTTMQANDPYNF